MYKLFLTLRYLTRRPLSLVAIFILTHAVAALVIAPSVMNGFQTEFHKRVRGTLSDVAVYSGRPFDFEEDQATLDGLKALPGVTHVAPYIENPALDRHLRKIDYCMLRGVDPVAEEQVSSFGEYLLSPRDIFLAVNDYDRQPADVQKSIDDMAAEFDLAKTPNKQAIYRMLLEGDPQDPDLPTCVVGIYYLVAWGLRVGDEVKLTTARETGEVNQDKLFKIVGAFSTGFSENDRRQIIMSIRSLQEFAGVPGRISGYSLRTADYTQAGVTRKAIEQAIQKGKLPGLLDRPYVAQTWEERNQTLLRAVAMEKLLIRMMMFLMVILASASIFLVLFMAVHTKVRELGILRAIGGTRRGVLSLFIGQGFAIALTGMLLGLGLGVLLSLYINEAADLIDRVTGWHPFPPEVYYLDKIPTRIDLQENAVNFVVTLALGSLAAIVPGFLAAWRPPLKSIRYE